MAHQTVVVGAGLAGLSAAYELVRAGQNVQVFEAQERVGGRTHTVQLSGGQYGELGAEFVDSNHTALLSYAAEFDLKLDPAFRSPHDIYRLVNGKLCNSESLNVEQSAALDHLYAELSVLVEQQADPPQTLEQWLDTHEIAPFACQDACRIARSFFTTDPELIGIGFFAYFSQIGNHASMRICGGSSRLAEALAKYLGERVHLSHPVRRIQQQSETITVSVETTSGLEEVIADSVVVAIPWSVLRHIPLEVPLTDEQRSAIAGLPYGSGVKTLLEYPRRFWSRSNFGIVLVDGNYQAIWEPTFAQMGTEKILSCFSGGAPSLMLSDQASDLAKLAVRTIYPEAPEAIASRSHNWSVDQWAQGSYCYFKPGDLHRYNPHLMLPAGQIFFAGEHTAPVESRGYMEGAIRSGQRAAQQILAMVRDAKPG
jgi:monoamine oxidase